MAREFGAAVVALAAVLLLFPAPGTAQTEAPQPSLGTLRAQIADAIAAERRARELIRKKPPRTRTARLALSRAEELLRKILASGPLPAGPAGERLELALDRDVRAGRKLEGEPPDVDAAESDIGWGLVYKQLALQDLSAFSLGADPIPATGTFWGGQPPCPGVATQFTDSFAFLAPGDDTLTITQPSTGDRVSGRINPDGTFHLRSAGESYDGTITRAAGGVYTAYVRYSYTRNGCTTTYYGDFIIYVGPEKKCKKAQKGQATAASKKCRKAKGRR